MPDRGSPTVRRLRLGQELRLLRERRNLTGARAAKRLGWSASKVSRIESAKTMPRVSDIEAMARLLEADADKTRELLELLKDSEQRGWWEDYEGILPEEYIHLLGLEAEAICQRDWQPQLVPGLLQTEAYAREVIQAPRGLVRVTNSGIRSRVEARLDRQKRVLYDENPAVINAILDESVLLRRFGEAPIMREQMEHLLEMSILPHVSLRILTLDSVHPVGSASPFIHLKFEDFDDVVYMESLYGARFVDDSETVSLYETAFDQAQSQALDEDESRVFIQRRAMHWRQK